MEGILSLKWNNHLTVLSNTLSSLHKKDLYSDVTLACGGQFFPVHKLILSACSDFFEELFRQTPCTHPVVILKDISVCDLEALLSYMYLGEANVAQSDLSRLIKAAECLCIKGLAVPDEGGSGSGSGKRPSSSSEDSQHSKRRKNEPSVPATSNSSSSSSLSSGGDGGGEQGQGGDGATACPPHHSPREGEDPGGAEQTHGTQNLAEVIIEEDPNVEEPAIVKEEVDDPKCDPDVEEIMTRGSRGENIGDEEDPLGSVGAPLNFTGLSSDDGGDGGGDDDGGGGGVNLYEHHLSTGSATHPVGGVLQELMVSEITGASVSTEMTTWDSMAGFPLEGLHSEDSRSSHTLTAGGCGREIVTAWTSRDTGTASPSREQKAMHPSYQEASHPSSSSSSNSINSNGSSNVTLLTHHLKNTGSSSSSNSISSNSMALTTHFLDHPSSVISNSKRGSGLSCPYCGKILPHYSDYERHLRKHTGDRPFACPLCPYATTRKSHLKRHVLCRHNSTLHDPEPLCPP